MIRAVFSLAVFASAASLALWLGVPAAPVHASATPSAGLLLFREKGCEHCHGADLQGSDKGPNLTGVGRRLKPEQIQHQIHEGGDNMPAFGDDVLDPSELALLTDFLAHQKSKKPATAIPVTPKHAAAS